MDSADNIDDPMDSREMFSLFYTPEDFASFSVGGESPLQRPLGDIDMDSPNPFFDRFSPFPRSDPSYGTPSPLFDRRSLDTPSRGTPVPLEAPSPMAMEGHSVPASSHSYIAQPISKRYEPVQVFQQPPHSAAAPTPINPQHYYSQQQQQPLQHQQQQQPPSMSPLTANLYTQHPGLGMQGYHPHYQAPNVQTLWSPMNILTSVAENVEEVPRSSSYSDVPMEKPKANAAQRGGSTSEPSPEAFAHPATAKEGNSKRQKRLERNRKSAQASRKRKKDTMIMAERRVRELAREVDQLRQTIAERAEVTLWNQRRAVLQDLERLLEQSPEDRSPADVAKLAHGVIKLTGQYGVNIPERRVIRDYIFTAISHTLLPPQQHLFLWLSMLPDDFYAKVGTRSRGSAEKEPGWQEDAFMVRSEALWKNMCNEVGITKEQATKLARRLREKLSLPGARDRLQHLVDATVAVENLRRSVLSRAVAIQEQLEHLRSVLKPEQIIRYLSWNERNRDKLGVGFATVMSKGSGCSSSTTEKSTCDGSGFMPPTTMPQADPVLSVSTSTSIASTPLMEGGGRG